MDLTFTEPFFFFSPLKDETLLTMARLVGLFIQIPTQSAASLTTILEEDHLASHINSSKVVLEH